MKNVARGTNYWLRMKPCLSYLSFDGSSGYLRVENGLIDIHKPFIIGGIFRSSNSNGDRTLFEFYGDSSSRVRFVIRNGIEAINEIKSPQTYDRFLWGSIKNIGDGKWHSFMAVVYPSAEKSNRQYVDGELQFTKTSNSSKWDSLSQPVRFTVAYPAYYCTWWAGEITSIMVYNDEIFSWLDSNNIAIDEFAKILFSKPKPPSDGLVLWLNCHKIENNVVSDLSGNSNDGIVYGGVSQSYEVYPPYVNSMLLEFKPKVMT